MSEELFEISREASAAQTLDHDLNDEELRRRAAHARTEDEYLEALREAGSLTAGIAVVNQAPAFPSVIRADFLRGVYARRAAEDAASQAASDDYYSNTPQGRAAAARVNVAMDAQIAAWKEPR